MFKNTNTKLSGVSTVLSQGRNNYKMNSLNNGQITKDDFLSIKGEITLPESILANPIQILALNYNCDSKVGSWTNLAMNICTAKSEEFIDESGLGANDKFFKAFRTASKQGKVNNYKRIFTDNVNVHTFTLKDNDNFKVETYYVSNIEVREFANRIKMLNPATLTVEDIKLIQADLWYLFRAWQESSIDMTKDKTKQFDVAMDEVLGRIKVRTNVGFADININIYDIKREKKKKKNVEDIPSINIDFAEFDDDDNEFLETSLSDMQHDIRKVAERKLQEFADAFVNSNNSMLESYVEYANQYPELAMTIMDLYRVIRDYNNTSKEEKKAGKKLQAKDYALLRAIAYNDAKELGIRPEEVCAIGLGVVASGGVYLNSYNDIIVKEYDPKHAANFMNCAERLFGNIIVLEKGKMYGSDMIVDDTFIKQEIEPRHIFEDVENGKYTITNGDVFDEEQNLLFDTNCELTGEVLVEDDGVFYLYDPLCEVEDIPSIEAVFVDGTIEEDDVQKEYEGIEFEKAIKDSKEYTIAYDTIIINNEEVAFVDEDYAIEEDKVEERELSNWYGIGGCNWKDEQSISRNNKFLLLSYDKDEINQYIKDITEYVK